MSENQKEKNRYNTLILARRRVEEKALILSKGVEKELIFGRENRDYTMIQVETTTNNRKKTKTNKQLSKQKHK